MIQRYAIWHLIVLTTLAAVLFATFSWSRPVAETMFLISIWLAIHMLIARRLSCYEAIFPGVVFALLTRVFVSEITGDAPLGSRWLELEFHPLYIAQLIAMTTVGCSAQIHYAQFRRKYEQALQSSDLTHAREKAAEH